MGATCGSAACMGRRHNLGRDRVREIGLILVVDIANFLFLLYHHGIFCIRLCSAALIDIRVMISAGSTLSVHTVTPTNFLVNVFVRVLDNSECREYFLS